MEYISHNNCLHEALPTHDIPWIARTQCINVIRTAKFFCKEHKLLTVFLHIWYKLMWSVAFGIAKGIISAIYFIPQNALHQSPQKTSICTKHCLVHIFNFGFAHRAQQHELNGNLSYKGVLLRWGSQLVLRLNYSENKTALPSIAF